MNVHREPDERGTAAPGADPGRSDPQPDDAWLDRELEADPGVLGLHLRELLAPEEDLGRVTTSEVDRALRGRSVLGTALDLLGTGWLTAREVLSDGRAAADGEGEGT